MDTILDERKAIIKAILQEARYFPNSYCPHLFDIITSDEQEQHFILTRLGWENGVHEYSVLFHIELKLDGTIWVHENKTDVPIEQYLMEKGIPYEAIKAAMF
ncbi:MAG: hypothetical protein HC912_03360 [Saprospiraceae bacterium]|nr:hypothetical protein [Saprospiraceae bacterium]